MTDKPEQTDLDFIQHPSRWPNWPRLPLIKDADLRTAVLVEDMTAYYLYEDRDIFWDLRGEDFRIVPPEEVVAEGWRVD